MKDVIMPKFGFTMEEGTVVRWLKKAGDAVIQGEPLVEVTTDKINMEVEAPATGTLADVRAAEGEVVPVTQVIALILGPGERAPERAAPAPVTHSVQKPSAAAAAPATGGAATPVAQAVARDLGVDLATVTGSGPRGTITREDVEAASRRQREATPERPRATPAARAAAAAANVDLAGVSGSGPRGRVQAADVAAVAAVRAPAPVVASPTAEAAFTTLPFAGMRKTIALRLQRSAQDAPHVTFDADVDATALEALRARANAGVADKAARVSVTAVLVQACAWALARNPRINSQLDVAAEQIKLMREANIGVAIALEDGLIVPVIANAGGKGLRALATELADLNARAKTNQLKPQELSGGTFTISNLGMYGIDRFTAIINPPESAILAVGRTTPVFVPDGEGRPVARPVMTLRLSADHRVIDGAVAARFMKDLREALERPESMLI